MTTILVVEDHLVTQLVLSKRLRNNGYEVATANNGKQALEVLASSAVDLIISDIAMPEMDGLDLLRYVRADENLRGVPVIILTTSVLDQHRFEASAAGADGFSGEARQLMGAGRDIEAPAASLTYLMDQDHRIHIDLAAQPNPSAIFAACMRAMLARVDGLATPEALASEVLAACQEPLAQAGGVSDRGLGATLAVAERPRRFIVELAGGWHHEASLPDLPVGSTASEPDSDDESFGAANLGVGLFLIRRLVDEVSYIPLPGGNRWHLVKGLPAATQSADAQANDSTAVTLDLPASYRYLNVLGDCVAELLKQATLPPDSVLVTELQLAVQETCTNIVDHALMGAAGRIRVTLTLDLANRRFVVDTWDAGEHTFDLAAMPDRFELATPAGALRSGLLRGSALLFVSATLVNLGNYLFNLIQGRWLGPAAFADLSLIVTLFLVTSFLTAGLQTPAARFSAIFAADRDLQGIANLRRQSSRMALLIGLVLVVIFVLGAPLWTRFFSTGSPVPFIVFGLFVPFFLVQGVDRGLLQGRTRFGFLAATYQVEMWSRLALSLVFVALGWSVNGAVAAIALSFVAAWLVARRVAVDMPPAQPMAAQLRRDVLLFTVPVLVAQLGQILINNSDVLIVRRFFPAEEAGLYASLALTGRIVFFATWSVVTAMFPIVAQRYSRGQRHRHLLFVSLAVVLAGSLVIVAITYLFPEAIVQVLFGPAYLSIAPLLWVYALATMFYALANVVINYRLSIGSTGGTYLAIAAGVTQVVLLWTFHASLSQVVLIQLALMAGLFVVLMAWDLGSFRAPRSPERCPGRLTLTWNHEQQTYRLSRHPRAVQHRRRAAVGDLLDPAGRGQPLRRQLLRSALHRRPASPALPGGGVQHRERARPAVAMAYVTATCSSLAAAASSRSCTPALDATATQRCLWCWRLSPSPGAWHASLSS